MSDEDRARCKANSWVLAGSEIQQKKVPRAYDEDELARITRKEGVASWYLNQFCRDKRKRRQNTSCEVRNAEKATTRYPNTTEEDESNAS